jgi:hypothetical protein
MPDADELEGFRRRLARARLAVEEVETFMHRALSENDPGCVRQARKLMRLTVGLRRGLDNWKEKSQ